MVANWTVIWPGELDTGREVGEGLIHDGNRSFDGKAGLPGGAEAVEGVGQPLAAPAFIGGDIAGGELPQMGHELIAIGETVGADVQRHARGEDLLSASAADPEHAFDGSAVDPGVGQGSELHQNLV